MPLRSPPPRPGGPGSSPPPVRKPPPPASCLWAGPPAGQAEPSQQAIHVSPKLQPDIGAQVPLFKSPPERLFKAVQATVSGRPSEEARNSQDTIFQDNGIDPSSPPSKPPPPQLCARKEPPARVAS